MEYLMHASSYFDVLFYALKYSMLKTHFFGLPFVKIFRQKPHFPQNPPPYTSIERNGVVQNLTQKMGEQK